MKIVKRILRGIVAAFFASTILSVVLLKFVPVWFTPLMFIRCYEQVKEGRELRLSHYWTSIDDISEYMPVAVMASEDANFTAHHGFDFKAIEHAAKRNITHPEKQKLGASTISQQTAKNVFLWPGRSWVRKGLEVYFTALIELIWTKERIMEVYLNSIEMGEGIYGIEAVSRDNWGLHASQLSREQCALVAVTLPNPRKFSSKHPSSYMQKRQKRILHEMKFVKFQ